MDIFEYAKRMETDGERYYRELATKNSGNPGIKRIMEMLADEEAKHYRIVSEMAAGTPGPLESDILSGAKNVFIEMRERNETIDEAGAQTDIYKKAQDIEKASWEFYEKCRDESEDERRKTVFDRISKEERKHYFLLDNIVELVSRPDTWLENAEWNHLDEY